MKKLNIIILFFFLAALTLMSAAQDTQTAPQNKNASQEGKKTAPADKKPVTAATDKKPLPAAADKKKPAKKKTAPDAKPGDVKNQVRVRAKVLEWRQENTEEFGLSAIYTRRLDSGSILESAAMRLPLESNYPDGSKTAGPGGRIFIDNLFAQYGNLGLVLEALERDGKIQSLFEPNITLSVDSQTPAVISTGSKVPYESTQVINNSVTLVTRFRDVGITLDVKILDVMYDEYVKLEMKTNVSGLTGNNIPVSLDQYENPILVPEISSRFMSNTLILQDKQTFITGILKSNSKLSRTTGVPWIAQIPLLKYFFSNSFKKTSLTELIFVVTPEIINLQKEEIE